MSSNPTIMTLGCRLNSFESEIMRRQARAAGLGDAVIVNSCAVTAEAERRTRQAIRRARRENPGAKIIVTGCAVQIDAGKFINMDEVDHVLGNREKLLSESYKSLAEHPVQVGNLYDAPISTPPLVDGLEGRARGVVSVQTGCDWNCTFCIIPSGRGPSLSVPQEHIVRQVRRLADAGCREVVVSGVDIASYGADLPGNLRLGDMLTKLFAAVPDLPRLRLSSIDPAAVDPALFDLIENEPRLMPHLHLSLQAGDDTVLKRMRRRHDRRNVIDLVAELRRRCPDIALGADLIAGFPTETDAMFENTVELVRVCGLIHLHVFPYSVRDATPAARMPQVPVAIRRARAKILRELGDAQRDRYLASQIGARTQILTETGDCGRTRQFVPVRLSRPVEPGRLIWADIKGVSDGELVGEAA